MTQALGRPDVQEMAAVERRRILAEYERRSRSADNLRYAPWHAAAALSHATSRRLAARLLHRAGCFPSADSQCLEIGHGSMGWLGDLLRWGVKTSSLHGIELAAERSELARMILPAADLRVGDACQLPWGAAAFDLVIASTVFTSILGDDIRREVATEIVRVLKPGGALLWYDFAVNNPRNLHVRQVSLADVRALFPSLRGDVRSVTLAPPIARAVAPLSWTAAVLLEALPFLRTHLLGVLVKASAEGR